MSPGHIGAGELFRAHASFVARFIVRIGGRQAELDDLVQDVFVVAHRRGGFVVTGAAKPTTWLAEIALRVVADARRTRRRKPEHDGDKLDTLAHTSPAPDAIADARSALDDLDASLETLDAEHRAVFVLFEIEGQSAASIADALRVPLGTVHSRLHTARRRVLEAFQARREKP